MYGMLDNLSDLGLEMDLPYEIFATSFNPAAVPIEEEKDLSGYFFKKEFTCPICAAKFNWAVLRQSKLRMERMDELRPVYKDIEALCYDVMMCVKCGYAAINDRFDVVSDRQRENLLEKMRLNYSNFMPVAFEPLVSIEKAIEIHKYALVTAFIKKVSAGEKAKLLIKLSWLYKVAGDEENTILFNKHAFEYLTQAMSTERFPIFGMGEGAVTYILASYAAGMRKFSVSLKFLSEIIVNQSFPARLRDLARDLKEQITEMREQGAEEAE